MREKKTRMPLVLLLVILMAALCLTVVAATRNMEKKETIQEEQTGQESTEYVEKWQEGTVNHNGKNYRYNTAVKSYLIMGIDKDGIAEPSENHIQGGQSDAMFLLVTNASEKTISVVSIHRNTMTRIQTCYDTGADAGYKTAQICTQHGYGDGMALSCTRTVEAVSHLFYGLPISGYLSLRMDAIPIINDAVGGVEVTVLEDVSNEQKNVALKSGETVVLNGDEAYVYLRTRDIGVYESATNRLRRQEQYITACVEKLKTVTEGNPTTALKIYESIEDYTVSNIDFAALATELKDYVYVKERLYTIPGETVMGEIYEEFYVDEDAFYEMLLDIFYTET